MGNKKPYDGRAFWNRFAPGEPLTHFTYEFKGPRAVDPLLLIKDGILLWHESAGAIDVDDNYYLWELAKKIVENPGETPAHSWVEWYRYAIIHGLFTPSRWRSEKPFPYKGLLISAIYFQESRRLCLNGQADRAWHLVAIGYYHLGQNTNSSTRTNTARAAKRKHADRSADVREMVLIALGAVAKIGKAKTVEDAKNAVEELIRKLNEDVDEAREVLSHFDAAIPAKTKGRTSGDQKNDVISRIRNLLDTWSLPSGPYPEIADAFAKFSKRRSASPSDASSSAPNTTEGIPIIPTSGCYLRLINHIGDEFDAVYQFDDFGMRGSVFRNEPAELRTQEERKMVDD